MNVLPVTLDQALDQAQAIDRANQAAQAGAAARQPDGDPEVAGSCRQLRRLLVNELPVGRLGGVHLVAVLALGLAGAGIEHGLKRRVVLEVGAAGGFGRERRQQGFQLRFSHAASGSRSSRRCTLGTRRGADSGRKSCRVPPQAPIQSGWRRRDASLQRNRLTRWARDLTSSANSNDDT